MQKNGNQCHAPTNVSNEDNEDRLYDRLQSVAEKCSGNEPVVPMEDVNVKFGEYIITNQE